jgi:hypothetical protein
VVRLYRVLKEPVRSEPSADVACVTAAGVAAVSVQVAGAPPVLVSVSTVTATLSCVMNLRWRTCSPSAVWTLDQWLGYCFRCAVSSSSVTPPTATV